MNSASCDAILPRLALLGALSLTACGSGVNYDLHLHPITPKNQSPFEGLDRIDLILEHADGTNTRKSLGATSGSPNVSALEALDATSIRLDGIQSDKVVSTGRIGPLNLIKGAAEYNILVSSIDELAWLEALPINLFAHNLVPLGEGQFLLIGGLSINAFIGTGNEGKAIYRLDLSDPQDPPSFVQITDMPTYAGSNGNLRARHGATAALLTKGPQAGKILVAGGTNKLLASQNITETAFFLDPESLETTPLDSNKTMESGHYLANTVVDSNGNVVILGGWDTANKGRISVNGTFEFFDVSSGQFERGARDRSLRGGGAFGMAAPLGDSGVVHCGGGFFSSQEDTWKMSGDCTLITTSGQVSDEIPSLPELASHGTMIALSSSELLLIGGLESSSVNDNSAVLEASNRVLHYDKLESTWTELDGLQLARANTTAEILPDGRVLILGGRSRANLYDYGTGSVEDVLACAEIYDPFVALNQPRASASTLLDGCSSSQTTSTLPTRAHSIVTAMDPEYGILTVGGLSTEGTQDGVSLWRWAPTAD